MMAKARRIFHEAGREDCNLISLAIVTRGAAGLNSEFSFQMPKRETFWFPHQQRHPCEQYFYVPVIRGRRLRQPWPMDRESVRARTCTFRAECSAKAAPARRDPAMPRNPC